MMTSFKKLMKLSISRSQIDVLWSIMDQNRKGYVTSDDFIRTFGALQNSTFLLATHDGSVMHTLTSIFLGISLCVCKHACSVYDFLHAFDVDRSGVISVAKFARIIKASGGFESFNKNSIHAAFNELTRHTQGAMTTTHASIIILHFLETLNQHFQTLLFPSTNPDFEKLTDFDVIYKNLKVAWRRSIRAMQPNNDSSLKSLLNLMDIVLKALIKDYSALWSTFNRNSDIVVFPILQRSTAIIPSREGYNLTSPNTYAVDFIRRGHK